MGLLMVLLTLLAISTPVFRAETCSRFRNLDNGRTFFRYGGLLVVFRCHPGYRLHGHTTNSCVSGQWSREPPVCVGSGCPDPGPLPHGTSSVNQDGSWTRFSCDGGFWLHGPSMLYCKNRVWNSTKPVCKESDMMRSIVSLQRLKSLGAFSPLKIGRPSHYDDLADNEDVELESDPSSGATSPSSTGERVSLNLKAEHLQRHRQLEVKHWVQSVRRANEAPGPETEPESRSSGVKPPQEEAEEPSLMSAPEAHQSLPVPLAPGTERSTSPAPSLSTVSTSRSPDVGTRPPDATLRSDTPIGSSPSPTHSSNPERNATSAPPRSPSRPPVCPYPPVPAHGTFYFRNVEDPGPKEYKHYIQYACYPGYTLAHGDVHSYCTRGGNWSGVTPVCLELTPCSVNNGGCSQLCSLSHHHHQNSTHNTTRTQCHCGPGFTLLDDGRTCRDVDECAEGRRRCQQRCINTFGSFRCACDDGHQPAQDQITCTDVDECVLPAAVAGCVFGCVNTVGSFYCECPAGYNLQGADHHCQDIDECAGNRGLGPCTELCHNSPGSFRCSCSFGRVLAGDGRSCVSECPPGYRKPWTKTPGNSTAPTPREECADIDECQEGTCEWQCINLPGSHRCICPRGYKLQRDGRRCKDINECSRKNGGCSHVCLNQRGGYKCACPASHRLSPYSWKKCLPRTPTNTSGKTGNHLSQA